MSPVKVRTDIRNYPPAVREHLVKRIDERTLLKPMAEEFAVWLRSEPYAPDLEEAPAGWHKAFSSFTVLGEGELIKSLYTIYAPGKPRRGSINLDQWQPNQRAR
ncbi:MAG: hypothetical protein LAO06_16235 [Acidobacteriia bacterium]|nr:hypothetical protein [Terriglobia bacterium]